MITQKLLFIPEIRISLCKRKYHGINIESDNSDKMAKILALAHKLGISVIQKKNISKNVKAIPPKGKVVSVNELLETFGKDPGFPSTEEICTQTWRAL